MTKREQQVAEFEGLLAQAKAVGLAACKDIPDKGCIGWAWVNVPANTPFGRWLKKLTGKDGHSVSGPPRGTRIDAEYPGQAIAGAMAYANAVEVFLKSNGIEAFAWQRYD